MNDRKPGPSGEENRPTADVIEWDLPAMVTVAIAMRPRWDREETRAALLAMFNANWRPGFAVLTLARHIARPESTSYDLLNIARNPVDRSIPQPADPSVKDRLLAGMRQRAGEAQQAGRARDGAQ